MKLFLSAIAVCSAVALSACTPALQQDSAIKVNTPSGAISRNVIPGYIDCFGIPSKQPSSLSLDCVNSIPRLEDISWEYWSESRAVGTGTLIDAFTTTPNVSVELSSPIEGVFTDLTVAGQPVLP
ncbi:hypothetical protein J5O04_05845 [Corynebacterium hindlerae]|uniref:hypothetical protein n=1 Tax=Corynebacterium hindlerae TaxID=699041 RepID=UPI001AD6B09C|nr:hypothetical protein [Corynebacterium hindlerae]QTH60625.1 hypothetical protein J5O04_05845 [Corynebacterium hindlerae]